jgi:hypothetical protein
MIRRISLSLVAAVLLAGPATMAAAAEPALAKCTMTFTLKGWSAIYKTASGRGTVTCGNGQTVPVKLTVHGGGLTFGKIDILKGKGKFSKVKSADEVIGHYLAAEATAGAVKAGQAAVYTKGEVSLVLSGTGRGVVVGFDFGKLDIERTPK